MESKGAHRRVAAATFQRRLDQAASVGVNDVIVTPAGPAIDDEPERFAKAHSHR